MKTTREKRDWLRKKIAEGRFDLYDARDLFEWVDKTKSFRLMLPDLLDDADALESTERQVREMERSLEVHGKISDIAGNLVGIATRSATDARVRLEAEVEKWKQAYCELEAKIAKEAK